MDFLLESIRTEKAPGQYTWRDMKARITTRKTCKHLVKRDGLKKVESNRFRVFGTRLAELVLKLL